VADEVARADEVVLVGFGRVWGCPGASPFASKLETWLRLAQVPYRRKPLNGLPKSRTGKIPYIERPGGGTLADSSIIIETLTAERGVTLDADLTEAQRHEDLLLQRTLEEHFYWVLVWTRWARPEGWSHVRGAYFNSAPAVIRPLVARAARSKALNQVYAAGIAKQEPGRILELAARDLAAVEHRLGSSAYLHGDSPRGIDAVAWAFVSAAAATPGECPLAAHVRTRPALMGYVARLRERVWSDLRPG
jgi:glutathione S-transferase